MLNKLITLIAVIFIGPICNAKTSNNVFLGMATPFGELRGDSANEMNTELDDYINLGVKIVRFDLWWQWIQYQKNGNYSFGQTDEVVEACLERGLQIVGLINGRPDYVQDFSTSYNRRLFNEFIKTVVNRYKGKIKIYEILNETNMHKKVRPEDYAKILRRVYPTIKSIDSNITVVSVGLAAVPSTNSDHYGAAEYLERVFIAGGGNYLDAVGFHPYTYPLLPLNPVHYNGWTILKNDIRRLMVKYGQGSKKIWVSELGAPTSGGNGAMNEADQVLVLEQAVDDSVELPYIAAILWYSYKDRGNRYSWSSGTENYFGLLRPDGSRKPSYESFKTVASYLGQKDDGLSSGAGSQIYTFTEARDYNSDKIWDFKSGDKIDLSQIDSDNSIAGTQKFNFIGSAWLKSRGDLGIYHNISATRTHVQATVEGDSGFELNVVLDGIHNLTEEDFIFDKIYHYTDARDYGSERIYDFAVGDKIDLTQIDADTSVAGKQRFNFIGSSWLKNNGDLGVYHNVSGNRTHIQATVGGTAGFELNIVLNGIHHLSENDFVLNKTYSYSEALDFGSDKLYGFLEGDKIDLSRIDADRGEPGQQSFNFINSSWLQNPADLGVYHNVKANRTHIQATVDGDTSYELNIVLDGIHELNREDFLFP